MNRRVLLAGQTPPRRRVAAGALVLGVCLLALINAAGAQSPARKQSGSRAISNAGSVVPAAAADAPRRREPARRKAAVDDHLLDEEQANDPEADDADDSPAEVPAAVWEQWVSPAGLGGTVPLMALVTVASLVPSILIMTTCFIRFAIVLGLLRQALGTPQLPPNQVLTALCLFLTALVMWPVWQRSYDEGVRPYVDPAPGHDAPSVSETFHSTVRPVRQFMSEQIERAGNSDTLWMLIDYQRESAQSHGGGFRDPQEYDDVPLPTLAASYMLSELKTAFVIGFQILLPFLVIDLVVAVVLSSTGLMMLPPTLVSFPFKLLLFVLIDGWMLTAGMLLASVAATGATP